jgi:hypothetical protein
MKILNQLCLLFALGMISCAAFNERELGSKSDQGQAYEEPRIDSLIQDRYYFAACHLEVDESKFPVLRGIPKAEALNAQIRSRFDERIEDYHEEFLAHGEDPYLDPECRGCYSDTLHFISFGYDVLDFDDSNLCLRTHIYMKRMGGTAWSLDYELLNVDLEKGEVLAVPEALRSVDVKAVDAFISEIFGDNGIGEYYTCHSCVDPDFIDQMIDHKQVGFIEGEWVGFDVIWPTTHGHAAERTVKIPLGRFVVKN